MILLFDALVVCFDEKKKLLRKMLTCFFLHFIVDQARTFRKAQFIVRPLGWNEAKAAIFRKVCPCVSRGFVKFERTRGWNKRRRGVKWWTCFCNREGSGDPYPAEVDVHVERMNYVVLFVFKHIVHWLPCQFQTYSCVKCECSD